MPRFKSINSVLPGCGVKKLFQHRLMTLFKMKLSEAATMSSRIGANYTYGVLTVLQKARSLGHSIKLQPNTTVFGYPDQLIISLHITIVYSVLFSTNSRENACYMFASYQLSRPLALHFTLSLSNTTRNLILQFSRPPGFRAIQSQLFLRISSSQTRAENATQGMGSTCRWLSRPRNHNWTQHS